MNKNGSIRIRGASSPEVVIEIEGIIGVPEQYQYGTDELGRVATYEKFRERISEIAQLKSSTVRVNIRSVGGDVNDALLIYDVLCGLGARVETHCYGYVASAATIIAQAASEGGRYVARDSLYLVHRSMMAVEGNVDSVRRAADLLHKTDGRVAELYAGRSGRAVEEFVELMGREDGHGEWLHPEEVVVLGLADVVEEVSPIRTVTGRLRNMVHKWWYGDESVGAAGMRMVSSGPKGGYTPPVEVKNKILELERENAWLKALPTSTIAKQDPDIELGQNRGTNQSAYMEDVTAFKQ